MRVTFPADHVESKVANLTHQVVDLTSEVADLTHQVVDLTAGQAAVEDEREEQRASREMSTKGSRKAALRALVDLRRVDRQYQEHRGQGPEDRHTDEGGTAADGQRLVVNGHGLHRRHHPPAGVSDASAPA